MAKPKEKLQRPIKYQVGFRSKAWISLYGDKSDKKQKQNEEEGNSK